MPYTAANVERAITAVLAKRRDDVVKSWASERDREKREALWLEYQSIESIEELLRHEFASIIESAAGGSGDGQPG